MCGLNGIYAYKNLADLPERAELLATRDHMYARGPDGEGEWWSSDRRLGLGHRRLSILDLSERAGQPMTSSCGRYVVVFNGEIYNYPDLRRELEAQGRKFRTTSDTEVLLHLFDLKGGAMVHELRGMFAFAVWDNKARSLFLARDPFGIKPLYTANDGLTFRFASQVKALLAGGRVSRDAEPAGIVGFHIWGSVPEPFTLYRDIRALPAGHTQVIDAAGPREPELYCSISEILATAEKIGAGDMDTSACVREAVRDSISRHLLADVDVGVFLSAGIDSSAILGVMRDVGHKRVRAVTVSFADHAGTPSDEAPMAAKVAQFYGAEHMVRRVDEAEFVDDLPAILDAMDQPSIDGVNTWFVAKAARESGLKVALSGIGGDELFAGYPSFVDVPRSVALLRIPSAVPGIGTIWHNLARALSLSAGRPKLPGLLRHGGSYPGAYLLRRGIFLPSELQGLLQPEIVADGLEKLCLLETEPRPVSAIARVAALESTNYLRHQLLRDADWAGMAHSIEIRTPLVDTTLLRQVGGLMPKFGRRQGKLMLSRAPEQQLPAEVTLPKKQGFVTPFETWLSSNCEAGAMSRGGASRSWALKVYASLGPDRKGQELKVEGQVKRDIGQAPPDPVGVEPVGSR